MSRVRRIPGSATTSSASRTWSTTTSPTCSTPTAASSSRNTAWPWSRTSTTSVQPATEATSKPSTKARRPATAPTGTCVLDLERGVVDRHPGQPLADRHLHRRLALQARHQVQDAEAGHRPAGRHRQPQRQPAAEFPAAQQRRARRRGIEDPRRDHQVDGRQQRRHLRHAAVEDLRRRPTQQSAGLRVSLPAAQPATAAIGITLKLTTA